MEEMNRKKQDQSMFAEIEEILLQEETPSIRLNELSETKPFQESVFAPLNRMKKTEQSKQHHPEGNVWIHTMMVVDEAAKIRDKSKDPRILLWSALLHDLGKPDVTKLRKGKITAYNHDRVGALLTRELLLQVSDDLTFIDQVTAMVRWHMQILFIAKNMSMAEVETMKQEVDVNEVALLGLCDRLGRLNANREEVIQDINKFRNTVK